MSSPAQADGTATPQAWLAVVLVTVGFTLSCCDRHVLSLLLTRTGIAAGEAGLPPAALTLMADTSDRRRLHARDAALCRQRVAFLAALHDRHHAARDAVGPRDRIRRQCG